MTRVVDLDQTRQWLPDGRDYGWHYGDADVKITITVPTGPGGSKTSDDPGSQIKDQILEQIIKQIL